MLSDFDHGAANADLWPAAPTVYGRAALLRRDDHTIVVIGENDLADTIRELLPFRGWNLWSAPDATAGTALTTIRQALGTRTFNILAREGFATVEEVAAVPDAGLRTLPNMGTATITTIRLITAAAQAGPDRAPVTLSARHVGELCTLLIALTRYAVADNNHGLVHQVDTFRAMALQPPPSDHQPDGS